MILTAFSAMASPLLLASGSTLASQTYRSAVQQIESLTEQHDSVSISALVTPSRSLVTGLQEMQVLPAKIEMASGIVRNLEEALNRDPQAQVPSDGIIIDFQSHGLIPLEDEDVDAAVTRLIRLTDMAQDPHQGVPLRTTHLASGTSDEMVSGIPFRRSAEEVRTAPERLVVQAESADGKPVLVRTRYELGDELGRGGMGVVYRAHDTRIRRDVAVKIVTVPESYESDHKRTQFMAKFSKEAELQGGAETPRILRVYDSGITGEGNPFIIMEMMRCSLWDYFEDIEDGHRRFELHRVAALAEQAIAAVVDTHKIGIVHQDIKPENFFIDPEGNVKLGDFGIAQRIEGTAARDREPTRGISGSPFYMSLEALAGAAPAPSRDIYALGMTLYEMFAGCLPYDISGKSIMQHIGDKGLRDPRPPSEMTPDDRKILPELDQLILKALGRKPKDRYENAKAMLTDMANYRAHVLERAAHQEAQQSLLPPEVVSGRGEEQVRLIGRDKELAALLQAFRITIADEKSRLVVVSGEAGQGKSRLGAELITNLEQVGSELSIFTAQGVNLDAKPPRGAIAGAIRTQAGCD